MFVLFEAKKFFFEKKMLELNEAVVMARMLLKVLEIWKHVDGSGCRTK